MNKHSTSNQMILGNMMRNVTFSFAVLVLLVLVNGDKHRGHCGRGEGVTAGIDVRVSSDQM